MSLPQAQKHVSEHPAAGSVVEPVDKQKQAADIDRKLRFYGAVTALRDSRMPTNDQIDSWLTYALQHEPVPVSELSPSGQTLVQDSREVINTLREIVREKNADELIQKFVWHTRSVDTDRAKKDPNEVLPVGQDKLQGDAQTAQQHLRTLASLVLTNAEFRKLLADFSVVGRDLLSRGAIKVAEQTRPNEERLRQVDQPAPDHQFVSEGGQRVGPDQTPIPEVQVPGTDFRVSQHPRAEAGQDARIRRDGTDEEWTGSEAANIAQQKKDELASSGQEEASRNVQDVQDNVIDVPEDSEDADPQNRMDKLQNKLRGVRDNVTGRVPQEHKDKANEHVNRAKNFLSDEYFPEERRDQLIFRAKKVIVECQNHKDYKESITWLINTVEEYSTHGRTIAGHGKDSHQQLTSDPALQQSTRELRTLLERFANGTSLDVIGDALHALYEDAQKDEGLRNWLHDIDAYLRECLLTPGYVLDDQCNERGRQLRENGRQFYDEKYRGHFDNLFNATSSWFGALAQDPLNKRFGDDWARLTKDLLFDSEGSLKYKPELWKDIRRVIVPELIANVGYVPIPRIEYTDDSLDLVLENLALSGKNLFPNHVSMEARNFFRFSPYDAISDQGHHEFTLTMSQIQADMRDVAFYYSKKTGMPKMTDSGLADVLLGGEGLTVTAHLVSADRDRSSVFKVKNVAVSVGTLKVSIRDSKHDTLYKTLLPLVQGLVKKQLQKAIGGAVQTALEYVDGELVAVRDQMAQAKADDNNNRVNVLKDQLFSKKEKAQEKTETKNSQFKVVTQPGEELLPKVGRPEGWVNRTQERREVAGQGEEWRSNAFNVV